MSSSPSHSKPPTAPPAPTRWGGSGGGEDEGGDGGGGGGDGGGGSVRVAVARNEAEGELIRTLLIEEAGIPSYLQSTTGLPSEIYPLAGRSVGVMVNASAAADARKVLADTWGETDEEQLERLEADLGRDQGQVSPGWLAFWILAVGLAGFLLLWVLYELS